MGVVIGMGLLDVQMCPVVLSRAGLGVRRPGRGVDVQGDMGEIFTAMKK